MSRIQLEEDLESGLGWVLISVSPPIGADVRGVSIVRRKSDKPNLGQNGWQAQPAVLLASARGDKEDRSLLRFGPEVTVHLSVDQDVTVSIPDADLVERHFWPAIAPAPKATSGQVGLPVDDPISTTVSPIPAGSGNTQGGDGNDDEGGNKGASSALQEGASLDGNAAWRSLRWWLLGIAVLAAVLAAGAVYYYRLSESSLPPVPVSPTMLERFETFRGEGGHADELHALGLEALEQGDDELGFRAMILSSDRGSAEANMQAGRWYDSGVSPESPVGPNANTAARYYDKAREAGLTDAEAALRALCARAEDAVADEPAALLNEARKIYCE